MPDNAEPETDEAIVLAFVLVSFVTGLSGFVLGLLVGVMV